MATTRGNSVSFDVTFLDDDGAILTDITTATLNIKYPLNNSFEDADVTLTENATTHHWTGTWETEVSEDGWVHYCARGENASGNSVADGKFKLTAGLANEIVDG